MGLTKLNSDNQYVGRSIIDIRAEKSKMQPINNTHNNKQSI